MDFGADRKIAGGDVRTQRAGLAVPVGNDGAHADLEEVLNNRSVVHSLAPVDAVTGIVGDAHGEEEDVYINC